MPVSHETHTSLVGVTASLSTTYDNPSIRRHTNTLAGGYPAHRPLRTWKLCTILSHREVRQTAEASGPASVKAINDGRGF